MPHLIVIVSSLILCIIAAWLCGVGLYGVCVCCL